MPEELAAELAELQRKVAEWKQQKKADNAKQYQASKAAADRVVVLEEYSGAGGGGAAVDGIRCGWFG